MRPAAALAACALVAACASAGGAIQTPTAVSGYLDEAAVRTLVAAFTPSPVHSDAEQAVFDSVEPGTDRWWLAIAHAELRPPEAAQHFDCVLGTRLSEKSRPALTRLMNRVLIDSVRVTNILSGQAPRRRPVVEQTDLQPCVRMDDAARNSPSWPAGGAVAGAAYGEMFAALAPDEAEAARQMGFEIGLSRALCRVNWHVDVTDGLRVGRSVFERAAVTPDFQADLEAARAEVTAARAEGLTNPSCAAERRALGPMPGAG